MKYVMFCRNIHDVLQFEPVIFGKNMVHADIAAAFIAMSGNTKFKPVSAGEITFTAAGFTCHGESTTLNLTAHERDARIIYMHDYGGGIFT